MAKGKFSEDEVRYAIELDCLGSMDFFYSFLNCLIGSKHKDKRIKKKNYCIDPNEYFYFKRKDSLYFIKEMFVLGLIFNIMKLLKIETTGFEPATTATPR